MNIPAPRLRSIAALLCFARLAAFLHAADPAPAPAAPSAGASESGSPAASPGAPVAAPNLATNIERPLRYRPDNGDFTIENGAARFNRPLYGRGTAFRVDASDRPEFGFATPRKGGVLRIGFSGTQGSLWLIDAARVLARYRPGSMIYEVGDPLLGDATLTLTAVPTKDVEGLALRVELSAPPPSSGGGGVPAKPVELILVYGGASNETINNRNGDIMGGRENTSAWRLLPADCAGQTVVADGDVFELQSQAGSFRGTLSAPGFWAVADASAAMGLKISAASSGSAPVAVGRAILRPGAPLYLAIQRGARVPPPALRADDLPAVFAAAERYRRSVVDRVVVDTPDPFVNAAVGAIAISGDGLWQNSTVMHGNIAWRQPLLGWRGQYVLDAYGWHDRAREHFRMWAARQNVDPAGIPPAPRADPAKNLATDDWKTLHSHGAIPARHYDMNLVFVDALLRHILWTGDAAFAREMWPFLQRHLAWEKRLFDRGGLYEAYACIWASDALGYNGGGAAHSTAYNYFHQATAARIARMLGENPAPHEAEAARIHEAMQRELWLPAQGWYAEYREFGGLKRAHSAAALWTVYHTIDSRVPDAFQAHRTLRYVDTHLPRIPVRGPGVPAGDWFTLPSSNWLPYEWSLNNVYLGETAHTALAYWQGGRPDVAWRLWKGSLLDAMFMGLNPGSLPNLSQYDVYRRETYRDFGDSTGIASRSLIEGLFGIAPDALAGELTLRPGFPAEWERASIRTPAVSYAYQRTNDTETFLVDPRFSKPMRLRLVLPARAERILTVEANGQPASWKNDETAIGAPRVVIDVPARTGARTDVVVRWSGAPIDPLAAGKAAPAASDSPGTAEAAAQAGHFARAAQGDFTWWRPLDAAESASSSSSSVDAAARAAASGSAGSAEPAPTFVTTDAVLADAQFSPVDLTALFNDRVTRIFKNEYLAPRSPHVSLSIPKQGIGSWSANAHTANIDDSGFRREAAATKGVITLASGLPLRTPGEIEAKNIVFVSHWANHPRELAAPLSGRARGLTVLVAGSTGPMQTQIDNGEIVVAYADGTSARLALHNPTTWWPIEQDYMVDDYAFRRTAPVPQRIDLRTGRVYTPKGYAQSRGGAATLLALPLDPAKELTSVTVRALSTESIIGLMAATLVR